MQWLRELGRGLALLLTIQLLSGYITLLTIHSNIPSPYKLPVCLSALLVLAVVSSRIFDPETHLIGRVLGALSMLFTAPLQASMWIDRSFAGHKVPIRTIILRTAIPAALPSIKYPSESPFVQVVRGMAFIFLTCILSGPYIAVLSYGGIIGDVATLLFLSVGASGMLSLTSAFVGALGERSPSPFRNALMSDNMGKFWGGNWNAVVSDALRGGLYEPALRRGMHRDLAALWCFVISGAAHEAVLVYCGERESRGEWAKFFILAGIAAGLERRMKGSRRIIGAVILFLLFRWLFVPVVVRGDLAARAATSMGFGNVLIQQGLIAIWRGV